MSRITIQIQLDDRQAQAYLRWLVSQYEVAMADVWHSDKYRFVPEGMRGPSVFRDHPHIAGINRTTRALREQIKQRECVR